MLISMIPASVLTALAAGYFDCTIEGVVLTSDNEGVEGVSVFVYDITEQEIIDYYDTNSNGKWSTSECVSGNKYLVSYYHRDYSFSKNTFIVDAVTGTVTLETVVLLSQRRPDTHIDIKLDLSELDVTSAETKATYQEIKDYVLEKHGLKVSTLYISQVKAKCGIIERENYNKGKEGHRVPKCPKQKEEAIMDALKHFNMI